MSDADLKLMRRIDKLHMEFPFAAGISAEGNLQLLVQSIFDGPVIARRGQQGLWRGVQDSAKKLVSELTFFVFFPGTFDLTNDLQSGEIISLSQCLGLSDDCFSRLLAALSGLRGDGLVARIFLVDLEQRVLGIEGWVSALMSGSFVSVSLHGGNECHDQIGKKRPQIPEDLSNIVSATA